VKVQIPGNCREFPFGNFWWPLFLLSNYNKKITNICIQVLNTCERLTELVLLTYLLYFCISVLFMILITFKLRTTQGR